MTLPKWAIFLQWDFFSLFVGSNWNFVSDYIKNVDTYRKFQLKKTSNKEVIAKKPLTNFYEMNSTVRSTARNQKYFHVKIPIDFFTNPCFCNELSFIVGMFKPPWFLYCIISIVYKYLPQQFHWHRINIFLDVIFSSLYWK